MIIYNKTKLFVFILFYFIANLFFANAQEIKDIEIIGNERLSNETIIIFSELDISNDINDNMLNDTIKKLYKTNYFQDVKLKILDQSLKIYVVENPIIESIIINGIKKKSLERAIIDITKKKEKYPYKINEIKKQKDYLLNFLRSQGYYFAEANLKISKSENNTVNIIYNFSIGERAKIKKIKFIGNKVFKSTKLKNIIVSEESKFWKFISRNKYLETSRINLDKNLLINFYKNNGYYNVKVKPSSAKVIDESSFELVFNIDSGKKYFFDNIKITNKELYSPESFKKFDEIFDDLKGQKYSINSIKKIMDEIDKTALKKEFVFINAKYTENLKDDKININILLEESEKFFVDRINIFGNFITEEKVIRNNLIIDEGDPFNKILFNKSVNNIKSTNIFNNVEAKVLASDDNQNSKVINITVEEKPTGEIFAGAGTGTSGSSIVAGIKENNYLGKGIKLDTNLYLSENEIKGKFNVINPNYKNSDKSINFNIESTTSDFMETSGYEVSRTGFSVGTGFEQYEDIFFNFDISNFYEKLDTSDLATDIKKKQEGDYFETLFSYALTLNRLNQNFQPTDGYYTKFKQTLPIYSDEYTIENTFNASKYFEISDNLIFSTKFFVKAVKSLDDNVRISKRVYIPSRMLRGFESGKIGPIDGTQYVGGNYGSAVNLNTTLPNLLYGYENIDFNLFVDAANLWEVDYDSSLDVNKIRSSTGLSMNWFTPVGPLSFSYAIPLTEADTDKTESFRFRIGTTF